MQSTVVGALALAAAAVGAIPTFAGLAAPPATGTEREAAGAIAAVEARFDGALAAKDRAALDPLLTASFTWVHASDGRLETREVWLAEAARGMALSRQRAARSVFEPTLAVYDGRTAVRTARIRVLDTARGRELWLRQTTVFVREGDAWRLASGQGTRLYEGPPLDPALHARYAGSYRIAPGRTLDLAWDGDALVATLPSGAKTQVFLKSPTEEAILSPELARLRFALGADGRPTEAALVRGEREIWRARRASP